MDLPKKEKTSTSRLRPIPDNGKRCIQSVGLPDEVTLEDGTIMTCAEIVSLKHKIKFSSIKNINDLLLLEEIKEIVSKLTPKEGKSIIKENTDNVNKSRQINVCTSRRRR